MSSTAVVLATGFAQPHRISNGMQGIRHRILADNPDARVGVYSWREFEQAGKIAATLDGRIIMAAHSWGGWFANLLAGHLNQRGVEVAGMFLADPVTRPPGGTLYIPPNVRSVAIWRKRKGAIPTAEIGWAVGELVVEWVDVSHAKVDECESFQAAVIAAARGT